MSAPVYEIEPATPASEGDRVDVLLESLALLVRERQELRAVGADGAALERNRVEIVRRQQDLARALIARYA